MGGDVGEFVLVGLGSFEIVLIMVGVVIVGVEVVVDGIVINVYVLIWFLGYYVELDWGMGFCVFNNIGIVVCYLRVYGKVGEVVVIDWDVYYGNGMEVVFYDDLEILMIFFY